ncbi:MAG: DinB family protein [Phycisphaerales bacterium]|nr:DinB family protein [Phycisphaerales bacterium]
MSTLMTLLGPGVERTIGYADLVTADIAASDFGRMYKTANSPAWCIGHLSIYPDRLMAAMGREDLMKVDEHHVELFSAGVDCKDDPDGKLYPAKDVLMARFRDRHGVLLDVLREVDDAVLAGETPNERVRPIFPTVGNLASFLVTGHIMMHLGQISTWRRAMGLGPCM